MERKGVSPVVGTILLIAITVALAAIVAMLVSGLGGRGAPPSAMLTVTAENDNTSGNVIKITISHEGGDDLIPADLEVQASLSDDTMYVVSPMNVSRGLATFGVGGTEYGSYTYSENVSVTAVGKPITVYVIHKPSKQKLFSSAQVVVE